MSHFIFLYGSPSSSLCMAFDSILSKIDEVFSINPSAGAFVFGDFNVHHKELMLELMYISLTENIRSSLTHLHGFKLLVMLL